VIACHRPLPPRDRMPSPTAASWSHAIAHCRLVIACHQPLPPLDRMPSPTGGRKWLMTLTTRHRPLVAACDSTPLMTLTTRHGPLVAACDW